MRHNPSTAPPAAAARGLGAVVLMALLALMHAAFSPGPSHLSGLDLDGCRVRAAIVSAHSCQSVAAAVVTAAGTADHQDGDSSQSCDASPYGPRQLVDLDHPPATSGTMPGMRVPVSPDDVPLSAAGVSASGAPNGSLVLRC
ncbi:hypothetical protein [Streptomyces sp. CdTB01]|uniref:hypothetical protein n=1 Tax=Streptomyces sp. CdTB01 TaxID=1725411 RepID=UPI00073AB9BD|nr:hypothetical protein [Streptomyces sp. CdTB01]ALV33232.1 hypothetical protein AS200_15235 [Streptomyces sp. CdTB01]